MKGAASTGRGADRSGITGALPSSSWKGNEFGLRARASTGAGWIGTKAEAGRGEAAVVSALVDDTTSGEGATVDGDMIVIGLDIDSDSGMTS